MTYYFYYIDLFHIGIDVLSLAISFMIVPSVYCKQVEKHVSRAEHVSEGGCVVERSYSPSISDFFH